MKEKSPELDESLIPSLDKLTAKIDKMNALIDFLMESKKGDTERFARTNEQIGELRGEIAEKEKKVKNFIFHPENMTVTVKYMAVFLPG